MRAIKRKRSVDHLPGSEYGQTWRPLSYLNFYRMALAAVFAVLYFARLGPTMLGQHDPTLFAVVSLLYFAFALLAAVTISRRRPAFTLQVNVQVLTDIVAVTLIMHASGGLTSGLGILIVVAIAGGSIIMEGRLAGLYAAVAALIVLGDQVYSQLTEASPDTAYTHAGLLGITFFATALLSYVLARRARESEALALQRGVDLANLEQLNDYIIRNLQSGVVVVDRDDRIRMINESGWHLLGMPVVRDKQPLASVSPHLVEQLRIWHEDRDRGPQPLQAHGDAPLALPHFTPLGTTANAGTLIFLEDATESTQQMQQMKLASVGRLTASIAHEIRNPLGAISHAAQLLGESERLDSGDRRLIEIISDHSRRMNTIIENVLQLSRRENSQPKTFELKPWLETFVEELRAVQQLDVQQVRIELDPERVAVYIDPSHLQQVLWNLCQNAIQHGAPSKQPFELILRGGLFLESRGPHLDVIDAGPGIDAATAQQIFDPFYTTAASGTGLGLYIARELCECNRARLSYLAVPTGGSCFRVSFADPSRIKV